MTQSASKPRGYFPSLFILISLIGLFIIAALTLSPSVSQESFVPRKPLIGVLFISVCIFGILAVIFPNQCSRAFNVGRRERGRDDVYGFKGVIVSKREQQKLSGHHPQCGHFASHVFSVYDKKFCATCSGLFLGAVFATFGAVAYFFGNWQIEPATARLIWVGTVGVFLGLLQPLVITFQRSSVKVISGSLIALGSFLIIVGIDELVKNVFVDVFLVFLSVFWLVTRIALSQWEHEKTCSSCSSLPSCDFSWRK